MMNDLQSSFMVFLISGECIVRNQAIRAETGLKYAMIHNRCNVSMTATATTKRHSLCFLMDMILILELKLQRTQF